MPKEAIAEKIAYEAGGKGTARRIVDALVDEPVKLKSQPAKPKVTNNAKNNNKKGPTVPKQKTKKASPKDNLKAKKTSSTQKNKKKNAFSRGFKNEL